jgi:hypothetical protein
VPDNWLDLSVRLLAVCQLLAAADGRQLIEERQGVSAFALRGERGATEQSFGNTIDDSGNNARDILADYLYYHFDNHREIGDFMSLATSTTT